jgi:hypothetical protein
MKDRLEIIDARIEITSNGNKTKVRISEVLSRYGTLVMVALDKGEVVWVTSEPKDAWKDERIGG